MLAQKLRAFGFNFVSLAGGRLANEDLYSLKELTDNLKEKHIFTASMAGGDLVSQGRFHRTGWIVKIGQGYSDPGGCIRPARGSAGLVAAGEECRKTRS